MIDTFLYLYFKLHIFQYVGLFMLGFHGGLLLGIVGLSASDPWFTPSSPWVSVGILLVTGLTMSLCNLYFQVRPSSNLGMK